jgi:hypothetical protein
MRWFNSEPSDGAPVLGTYMPPGSGSEGLRGPGSESPPGGAALAAKLGVNSRRRDGPAGGRHPVARERAPDDASLGGIGLGWRPLWHRARAWRNRPAGYRFQGYYAQLTASRTRKFSRRSESLAPALALTALILLYHHRKQPTRRLSGTQNASGEGHAVMRII